MYVCILVCEYSLKLRCAFQAMSRVEAVRGDGHDRVEMKVGALYCVILCGDVYDMCDISVSSTGIAGKGGCACACACTCVTDSFSAVTKNYTDSRQVVS